MIRTVPLSEVAKLNPRVPKELAADADRAVSFVPMAAVSEEGRVLSFEQRRCGDVLKGFRHFQQGDVLLAKITPCMENGKAAFAKQVPHGVGFGSTEFHVLRPRAHIDGRYLFYMVWNPYFRYAAERNMTGTAGQKRVPPGFVERFEIPLPPLPEQRRIAAILDKADAVRKKRRQALDLADQFLRSAFLELVGPRAVEHEQWPEVTIESLAADCKGSMRTGPFGSDLHHSEFVSEGIAVLGIDNAVRNRFAWDERRFITPEKYQRLKRYTVSPGDVIVTIMGTTGRSAVVPDDIPLTITTKHLATITLDRRKAYPEFVSFAIHSHPGILAQIARAQRGAIMGGLNLTLIKELRLRVPPLERQERFVETNDAVAALRKRLEAASNECEVLFNSLVQRAFRGVVS